MRESQLYPPIKAFLEFQGYAVKGEVGPCDIMAVRGNEPPVVVEMKLRLTLDLVLQGVDRLKLTDLVYLAVPPLPGRTTRRRRRGILALCQRLGLGMMTVTLTPSEAVQVVLDPTPYRPRKNRVRAERLLGEFQRRVGDPSAGGSDRSRPGMTAYRQSALLCAQHLGHTGPDKASSVAAATGVPKARAILYRDVYGWFERVDTGIYRLTPMGEAALETYDDVLTSLPVPQAP